MNKITIETTLRGDEIENEDGGQSKMFNASPDDGDNGFFVQLRSWDDKKEHIDFNKFINKKIRITIETIY